MLMLLHIRGSQKTTCERWFSSYTTWDLETELWHASSQVPIPTLSYLDGLTFLFSNPPKIKAGA